MIFTWNGIRIKCVYEKESNEINIVINTVEIVMEIDIGLLL